MPQTKSNNFADLLFMLYPHFAQPSTAARSRPAVCVASPAPEAGRRCIRRLRKAMSPWSSRWSLQGPRWMRSTKTAVAPEGFLGCFWEWRWRGDWWGLYIGRWFSVFALGCWVVLAVQRCISVELGWASWNSVYDIAKQGGQKWKNSKARGLKCWRDLELLIV